MLRQYLILLLLLLGGTASAQQGVYIPMGDTIWLSGNANVGIFSDMINNGILGTNPGTILYFLSKQWTNGNGATLSDESVDGVSGTGGKFQFSAFNPLYGNIGQQRVFGGYSLIGKSGASFPNLEINNAAGLLLDDLSDLKIRNQLQFTNGHLYLNGWNLQVGDKTPGTITGYSDKRFIVTGSNIAGGALYRAGINEAANKVVFPVGATDDAYSPAAILITGATDGFSVRAFDSVYTYAAGGAAYPDSFVNKTWNIRREDNTGGKVDVILQHMDASELPAYAMSRDSSYITHFVGNSWDTVPFIPNRPLSGTLTTSPMQDPATMHLRTFNNVGSNEYFAKTAILSAIKPATFVDLQAYRITPSVVQLDWTTKREVKNSRFELERRYEREETFTKITSQPTKAPNGYSNTPLDYTYQDLNEYNDWTYYRVKAIDRNGKVEYSPTRAVSAFVQINVYPNPNDGKFKVSMRAVRGDMVVEIRDTWSQVLRQYDVQSDTDINITDLASGIYFLTVSYKDTMKVAYSCKIVVAQ